MSAKGNLYGIDEEGLTYVVDLEGMELRIYDQDTYLWQAIPLSEATHNRGSQHL